EGEEQQGRCAGPWDTGRVSKVSISGRTQLACAAYPEPKAAAVSAADVRTALPAVAHDRGPARRVRPLGVVLVEPGRDNQERLVTWRRSSSASTNAASCALTFASLSAGRPSAGGGGGGRGGKPGGGGGGGRPCGWGGLCFGG